MLTRHRNAAAAMLAQLGNRETPACKILHGGLIVGYRSERDNWLMEVEFLHTGKNDCKYDWNRGYVKFMI